MWKITAPNTEYNRKIGTVRFADGSAETDDPWMADWFSGRQGFEVTEIPPEQEAAEKPTGRKAKE